MKTWRETRRRWARGLKRDTYAQYLACCDPRVPWYAEALAAGSGRPRSWAGAAVNVAVWLLLAALAVWLVGRATGAVG